jgi:hypothetical protein
MKIFQVKYNEGKYAYYKAKEKSQVNMDTKIYLTYTDARDEINPIVGFEYIKLRDSLIKYYA